MKSKRVISSFFWSFGERIIAQIVSFVVSIILARLLTPNDYGVVAILLIFINLADVFVASGFGTALIQDRNANDDDFSTIFYCSLFVSVIIYVILYISSPLIAKFYNNQSIVPLMRILALRLPISAYNTVQRAYISRHMLFKKFFYVTLIGTTISAVVGIYMAYNGAGAWALIAQYMTNAIIDSITLSTIVVWKPKLVFIIKRAKVLMGFGWKVLAAELIGTLFDQLHSLTIGKVFSPADLAFYNKGSQIPNMISSNINNSVMSVIFPSIANHTDNLPQVKQLARKSLRMLIFIALPIMVGLSIVSKPVIYFLLTEKWAESIPYMSVLCYSTAIGLIGNIGLQVLKAVGRSDLLLKIELYKKPMFIFLLLVGIRFDVIGVALSALAYSLYATLVNLYAMGKTINYHFLDVIKDVINVGKLSVFMFFITTCIKLITFNNYFIEIAVTIIVGVFSYIIVSKISNSEEFDYLLQFVKLLRKS